MKVLVLIHLQLEYHYNMINPLLIQRHLSLDQLGINLTDNTNNNTTGLQRLSLVQQAFQAVQLPPNATTLKINDTILVDAGIANKNTTINDGGIIVNNDTVGTINTAITLNQTGATGGILVEEVYNQRNATNGEFNRMSFLLKIVLVRK